MASEEEVVILARLAGTRQFLANATEMGVAIEDLGLKTDMTGRAFQRTARHGYLMNQALFTIRRLLYGVTLGVVAGGIAALKWGFNFQSSMQQARVALYPVRRDLGGVQKELNYLFNFTKYTPFQFKDMTIAFRQMFFGFRVLHISANETNQVLKAMVDNLSATGKTTPGALNRVSVALQHMANIGRLTGQTVMQLARDGIQIFPALRKELHLTADQMHHIGNLGIPVDVALRAIVRYTETTPGLMNAAHRQATQTLHGLATTFRDNVSQLMANLEQGVFGRTQRKLVAFNAWFSRFSYQLRHHASFEEVIRDSAGHGAAMIWHEAASNLTLFVHIFFGLIRDLFLSKAAWAVVFTALVLIHGILVPVNYLVQHQGWLLNVIIPLWVAYKLAIWGTIAAEKAQIFWAGASLKKTKDLTFAEFLLRGGMLTQVKRLKELVLGWKAWAFAMTTVSRTPAWKTLSGNRHWIEGFKNTGIFARFSRALFGVAAAFQVATAAAWGFVAPILANPITWIVLAVIALTTILVVLYFKWKRFHDSVNATVSFLWHHPLVAMFVPIIGPLFVLAKLFKVIYDHLHSIYDLFNHPIRFLTQKRSGGWFNAALHFGTSLLGFPGLQSGGTVLRPGLSMVGERGPELLMLPRRATVVPLDNPTVTLPFGRGAQERQPIIVQLLLGKKVLAEAVAEVQLDAAARA